MNAIGWPNFKSLNQEGIVFAIAVVLFAAASVGLPGFFTADNLVAHVTDDGAVVVIEYQVHGTILAYGTRYDNRFCSIIKIENRKVTHWRDYMDSLGAWNSLTNTKL